MKRLKEYAKIIVLASAALFGRLESEAQRHQRIIVSPSTTLVDGNSDPYNTLVPGDTLFFQGGNRAYLFIRNFSGNAEKPVMFVNLNGVVTINTDWYYGIKIANCRYIRLSGSGDPDYFYGFRIDRVKNGAGLSVGELSSDFEVDHLYINNVPIAGVYAKSDPDCSLNSTRTKFTQYNTVFHDNYVLNTGNEGFYIGSSFYGGETIQCNNKDTVVFPAVLNGVKVYNNIVKMTGWDGIQVGSASVDCKIYNNIVLYDSQAGVAYQMSGILIGGGSRCDCYNNYIYEGKGDGIESLGLGGYRIYNNVIVDAGRTFQPGNPILMKHGIYVGDVSTVPGSSYSIMFNDIINPKSNGIRFASVLSRKNLVASNAIINPGSGSNGYIVVTSTECDVTSKNNYLAPNSDRAGFKDSTYVLLPRSPLIDAGYKDFNGITFDYFNHPRSFGVAPDIGINEYNPGFPPESDFAVSTAESGRTGMNRKTLVVHVPSYPDQVKKSFTVTYTIDTLSDATLDLYNMSGDRVFHGEERNQTTGRHTMTADTGNLPEGIYLFTIHAGPKTNSGKFLKIP